MKYNDDVIALARARYSSHRDPLTASKILDGTVPVPDNELYEASLDITALAAQGWRITRHNYDPGIVIDPASPDKCPDCGPYAPCPRHDEWLWNADDLSAYIKRREQTAVRAALEGLRADMVGIVTIPEDEADILAIIAKRLAALDE